MNNLTHDDLEDLSFLKPGTFAEIINYEQNSSIPKNKPWMIIEYNSTDDLVKIVSLNKKKSYRIESWRLSPINFNIENNEREQMIGGYFNVDTDEE